MSANSISQSQNAFPIALKKPSTGFVATDKKIKKMISRLRKDNTSELIHVKIEKKFK
ncbi:MAG: hypothetical protein MJK11_21010 [Pseudomonadales bacterium]|nr:hypothetical protein [Pseudomonadales bacterium]